MKQNVALQQIKLPGSSLQVKVVSWNIFSLLPVTRKNTQVE